MIRYLSTGSADLARLLSQSHAQRPSPVWAEAALFFGFEMPDSPEPPLAPSQPYWVVPAE